VVHRVKTPCELVVGRILPVLRASVVRELSKKHKMKQSDIAKKLGITQASVSQYLSSARGGGSEMLENFPKIEDYAETISRRIVAGEPRNEWHGILCQVCRDIRSDEEFCRMYKVTLNLDGCDVCKG
jgi:predicted transcriptional regulator